MARDKIKNRGARIQRQYDIEDALREHKVPKGMMGSAFGFNRPKRPSLVERFKEARKARNLRKNPPPRLEGAVDISDIEPRKGGKSA